MEAARRKRIMTVVHHATLSDGLVALITGQPDLEVVATVSRPEETRKTFLETSPDVSLVDMDIPNQLGPSILRDILAEQPNADVIALVSYEWDSLALDAVSIGARAFLAKDRIDKQLLSLIRSNLGR